ncbi:MAG: acyl-CoA thioesterase [Chloroflexota bacterium]|nr:acyl-CoA thioesterase [Chloroflexota bacterium]
MTQERGAKPISMSRCTLSALMGPQEANALGNVHGGVIMKMVDEAGALAAMRHAAMPVVTVVIDSMTFVEPIRLGYLVVCKAELTYVGRTSMEVRVEVTTENPFLGDPKVTNSAYLVYVAIDEHGHPTMVPSLIYQTPEEQARSLQAEARQQYRKQRHDL